MSHRYKHHILTDKSVVILFDEIGMVPIPKENPLYEKIAKHLLKGLFNDLWDLVDVARHVVKHTNGNFWVKDGCIFLNGEILPDSLSKRVIAFADQSLPYEPLIRFWDNLKLNPSEDSKRDLYTFLEHNGIPLTEDGCFIGYKRITEDFKDLRTRTLDYSIGKTASMPREQVDADRHNTCSHGLHVANFNYANNFYPNGKLVALKVNPKDVVAVPIEYQNEKMRVCEYTILEEIDGPRKEQLYSVTESGLAPCSVENCPCDCHKGHEVDEDDFEDEEDEETPTCYECGADVDDDGELCEECELAKEEEDAQNELEEYEREKNDLQSRADDYAQSEAEVKQRLEEIKAKREALKNPPPPPEPPKPETPPDLIQPNQ